ncbi:MAG: glycerol-3-phosphate acyltransferase [Anaerolineales bacterium]|nr:glycerol-3-phosphate acyltransferase [Anaerolineales bacterium]
MQVLTWIGLILFSYSVGSIPFGYILVKLKTGKDIRRIQSGRTGGTNAGRAAGKVIGLSTTILDALKSIFVIAFLRAIIPDAPWLHVIAGLAAILGHNYSIYMTERDENGKIVLHGGAGGATNAGACIGFWFPSIFIIIPVAGLVFYFIGYASVTTISSGLMGIIILSVLAILGKSPWQYIVFAVIATALLVYELRENIKRLINGTERLHGFRAKKLKEKQENSTE